MKTARAFSAMLLVLCLVASASAVSNTIAQSDEDYVIRSSDPRSNDYTPTTPQLDELDEAYALLVRDVIGWFPSNQDILNLMPEVDYVLATSTQMPTLDLSDFTFIIIAGNQNSTFNQNILNNMDLLEDYVNGGGWLYFHFGTNTHTPHLALWDGTTYTPDTPYENNNFMGPDGNGHPILAGIDEPYYGTSANHGSFNVYPDESLIIIVDSSNNPTTIEFDYGQGKVVASTTPLEHAYFYEYNIGDTLWNTIDWMANRPPAGPAILSLTGTITEVPPGGGMITYDLAFEFTLNMTVPGITYWTSVDLPNGQAYGPLFQQMFTITPFMNVNIIGLTQNIPAFAPAGTYTFYGHAGYMAGPFVEDSFDFNKTGTAADGIDNWNAGGPFMITGDDATTVSALPSEFELQSVYPNPFNPAATVGVALPQTAELNVSVFNVTGQKVADLASGQFSAGTHQFTFDGSGLTSGIYFVRAVVPGALNAVEKVTLMK